MRTMTQAMITLPPTSGLLNDMIVVTAIIGFVTIFACLFHVFQWNVFRKGNAWLSAGQAMAFVALAIGIGMVFYEGAVLAAFPSVVVQGLVWALAAIGSVAVVLGILRCSEQVVNFVARLVGQKDITRM